MKETNSSSIIIVLNIIELKPKFGFNINNKISQNIINNGYNQKLFIIIRLCKYKLCIVGKEENIKNLFSTYEFRLP